MWKVVFLEAVYGGGLTLVVLVLSIIVTWISRVLTVKQVLARVSEESRADYRKFLMRYFGKWLIVTLVLLLLFNFVGVAIIDNVPGGLRVWEMIGDYSRYRLFDAGAFAFATTLNVWISSRYFNDVESIFLNNKARLKEKFGKDNENERNS